MEDRDGEDCGDSASMPSTHTSAQSYASVAGRPSAGIPQQQSQSDRQELRYWECRRAIRIRPVAGGNEREALIDYLKTYLLLDESFIGNMGCTKIERIPFGAKTKFKNEMVVTFSSVEARDIVQAAAVNLGAHGPEIGVRLEIPNHLKKSMRVLQNASYALKQKHLAAKRNVLFDDEALDLRLDFCLEDGSPWRRMTPKQAIAAEKRINAGKGGRGGLLRDDEMDDIFGPCPAD